MTATAEPLLRHFHRLVSSLDAEPMSDTALLERFVRQRDEGAFAALVARHGPMVLGVCRRVLRDRHEAEDAFQATFLILARKAGSLRRPQSLAAWLYGTARRLALTARRARSRRLRREVHGRESLPPAQGDPLDELRARELLRVLDEEMARLPEAYRLPMILCGLEGRSREEAARLLGGSAGSVKGRLEHGRARLRARLYQRGWVLSTALLPAAMTPGRAARVPAALIDKAVHASRRFAAGVREGIAAEVWTLAQTGIQDMTAAKVKMTLVLALTLCVLAAGAGMMAWPAPGADREAGASQPAEPAKRPRLEAGKLSPRTDLYGDPLPAGAIARLGTVRFRHGGWLMDVLVSPDGRTLISGGGHSVEIWDAQTGRRKWEITFPQAPPHYVSGIDLSPDGKLLVVNRYERNKMRFWDLASGAEVYPFGDAAPEGIRAKFSPDGKLLATHDAQRPSSVSIWDVHKGKKIWTIEGTGSLSWFVRSLAFSPDSKLLAFPGETGIRVWDLVAGKELYRLDAGTKTPLGCVVFSADGKLLAAAGNPAKHDKDHAIYLWDMATGKKAGTLKGHEGDIHALVVSPKDNVLASASRDGTIRFWDLQKRQEIARVLAPQREYVALHFSADGRGLVSGENDGVLRLWDVRKHEELAVSAEVGNSLLWVRFAPDGQTLISTEREQMGLWDPLTGRPRRIFHKKSLWGLRPALSPDGKTLATVDLKEGQIILWDVATGKLVRRFGEGGQPASISSCAFSPDGRRLAGGFYQEDIGRVWDVASGKELRQLKGQHMARSIAFAPDGATLVSASVEANSDYTVRLWKLASGEEIWRKVTRPWTAFNLAFSPDGRTLALVGGKPGQLNTTGEVRLWEAATGKELKHFEGHRERVGCVAFSPDGRMLATGSQDDTVRLWEIATGQQRQHFQGHQQMISAVSFSPDGRLLASASADTTALVWDLTGRFRDGRFRPRPLSSEELNRCWDDLAHADAARAYRSVLALTGSPKESVAFLKDHLPPVRSAAAKCVAELLAALDSDRFAERDKAMIELEKMGLAAEPPLRKALNAKPSLEVRRRIEGLLEKLAGGPSLRALRAIEVLEHIAMPEARRYLAALAEGDASAAPTQEAKAALQRLSRRSASQP
jgi:RNA polymerase sigma factor (sigma-70 family)